MCNGYTYMYRQKDKSKKIDNKIRNDETFLITHMFLTLE